MKKLILSLLAVAGTLGLSAESICPVGDWNNLPKETSGTDYDVLPLRLADDLASSQTLFTAQELTALAPSVTAVGSTKKQISSVTIPAEIAFAYGIDGALNIVVNVENVSATEFPKVNDKYHYLPYGSGVKGHLTVDANYTSNIFCWEDGYTNDGTEYFTISLDTPITYEGESLLLTWFSTNELGSDEWLWGTYTTSVSGVRSLSGKGVSESTGLSGEALKNYSILPILQFECEDVTETFGPSEVEGDPAVAKIGEKVAEGHNAGEFLPYNPDYNFSVAQALYTDNVLSQLVDIENNQTKAKICGFKSYFYIEEWLFYFNGTETLESDVYAFVTDAQAFPTVDGKECWFDYSNAVHGKAIINADFWANNADLMYYGGDFPMSFVFDTPLEYNAGQSIVITWISQSDDEFVGVIGTSTFGKTYEFEPNDGLKVHSAVLSDQKNQPSLSGEIPTPKGGKFSALPYIELDYIPVTVSGGEAPKPVLIENVVLGLEECTVKGSAYNNITATFDLNDPTACGEYEIKIGTTSLGTVTATEGIVINYLPLPAEKNPADLLLSVVPKGDGAIGTNYTIAAADINALFPVPTITPGTEKAMTGSVDHYSTSSTNLQVAATFNVATSVSVAKVRLGGNDYIVMSKGDSDAFDAMIPETATSYDASIDINANGGVIAVKSRNNVFKANVSYGELRVGSATYRMTLNPTVEYPVAVTAAGSLNADASVTTSTKSVAVAKSAAVTFDKDTDVEFTFNANNSGLPRDLETVVVPANDGYEAEFVMIARYNHTIHHSFVPTSRPQGIMALSDEVSEEDNLDWTKTGKSIARIPMADLTDGNLYVREVNDAEDVVTNHAYSITASGDVSGISDITVDAATGAEFFNLQGQPVNGTLAPGVYIRRQGNTATKVFVK